MPRFTSTILTVFLLSCTAAPTPSAGDALTVVTTIYPLQYLAERVGGDHVNVTNLTGGGVEPHEYELTPSDRTLLQHADVVLWNGGEVDSWMTGVVAELEQTGVQVVEVLPVVKPLPADPHFWHDPRRMMMAGDTIANVLRAGDAAHDADYSANTDALANDLQALDAELEQLTQGCALHDVVTAHDAYAYLAERAGFTLHAIAGISPDEEPTPRHMQELQNMIRDTGVETVFFETLTSPALAEALAKDTGVQTGVLNPLEGLTQEDLDAHHDYLTIMRSNFAALRRALHCQ